MLAILETWGAICPDCGSPYHLEVVFTGTAELTADGTSDNGGHEFDSASGCDCRDCGWSGKFGDAESAYESLPDVDGVSLAGGRKVRFAPEAIAAFNRRWPCSTLRAERAYWFEFDATGDLVDTDCPEQDDGPAASALADDAKAWLRERKTPEWA